MRTPRVALVATLLTLTLFAGCGGDDKKDSDSDDKTTVETSDTTSASPTEATPMETADTSVTPMDPTDTADVTQEQLDAALLTPEEVGTGFVLGTYTDEPAPPLCDPSGTPVDETVPPQLQGGTEIDQSDGIAAVQEEIAIYETEALATQAFGLAVAGLACTDGSADGTPITIGAAQDVTAQVNTSGIGTSTAWEVSSDSFNGVIVATVAGRLILATQFAAAPDADTSAFPNPVDVAAAAFAKALAS